VQQLIAATKHALLLNYLAGKPADAITGTDTTWQTSNVLLKHNVRLWC
jgi:hypothetical protein